MNFIYVLQYCTTFCFRKVIILEGAAECQLNLKVIERGEKTGLAFREHFHDGRGMKKAGRKTGRFPLHGCSTRRAVT